MSKSKNATVAMLLLVGILAALQLARFGIRSICFLFFEKTRFSSSMASMIAISLLSVFIILIARKRSIPLSVFPKRFTLAYMIATLLSALIVISTPFITREYGIESIALLIYSSIVTPIFEELIFRGFVWNKLNEIFKKEWQTYLVSSLLFAVWHLGYIDGIAFRVESGLANVMIWKAVTGLCFGIVLGALRLITKNSYSTMLLHGVMNVFGR